MTEEGQIFYGKLPARPEAPLSAEVTRELLGEDIDLRLAMGAGASVPRLKSLRATHHKLAQCIAMGKSDAEASLETGYTGSRISVLKQDPAFQDLVAHYRQMTEKVFVDVVERMAGFATDAVEVLQERLDTRPDSFTNRELNELVKTTADRGGFSPVQKRETKTITVSAEDLLRLKKEVETEQNGTIRKINQAEETDRVKKVLAAEGGESLPKGGRVTISSNDNRPSSDSSAETETSRGEGEGDSL